MADYTKYNLVAITNRRKELNLSQRKLAALCGLSISTIQGYEQGKFSPKLENISKICEALEMPVSSVVQVEDLQTFDSPLAFELAWLHNGGDRHRSTYGRQASAILALEKLTEEGQEKALELLDLLVKIPEYQK